MEQDERREGDNRAFMHDKVVKMKWWPADGYPFRWKPKHGEPGCIGEQVTQFIWTHRVLIYIAVITTASLVVQIFNPSIIGSR